MWEVVVFIMILKTSQKLLYCIISPWAQTVLVWETPACFVCDWRNLCTDAYISRFLLELAIMKLSRSLRKVSLALQNVSVLFVLSLNKTLLSEGFPTDEIWLWIREWSHYLSLSLSLSHTHTSFDKSPRLVTSG